MYIYRRTYAHNVLCNPFRNVFVYITGFTRTRSITPNCIFMPPDGNSGTGSGKFLKSIDSFAPILLFKLPLSNQ